MTSIESSEQSIFIEACEIGLVKALIVLRSLLKQVSDHACDNTLLQGKHIYLVARSKTDLIDLRTLPSK